MTASTTAPAPPHEPAADRGDPRRRGVLVVLCGAVFLEGLDVSMMGVALPSIQSDLDMSTRSLQWIVSAYVLGYGGFLLLGGRAADLLGRRRMFLAWLAVFVAFSGLGGLATDGSVLIAARFVTGVSAGFLTPAGLSIITTTFDEGAARNRALLVYAGFAAGGFQLGLVVGGLLTEISWRWVFFAPVIIATGLLIAAVRLVPGDRHERQGTGFDVAGAAVLTAAMLLLVFSVVEAPEVGWGSARTIASLFVTAALLAGFVAIERRSASPLVRLGILRSAPLVRACLGAMCLTGSFVGFQFIAVLYMQQARGWSAIETGLALLPGGIDAVLAPMLATRLVNRFGVTPVIAGGLAVVAVAYALFLPIGLDSSYAVAILPTMVLIGIGFALVFGPINIAATNGIAPHEQGLAGGLVHTSFEFGSALGLAVVAAVNAAATGPTAAPGDLLDGSHAALWVPVAAALLGLAVTAARRRTIG